MKNAGKFKIKTLRSSSTLDNVNKLKKSRENSKLRKKCLKIQILMKQQVNHVLFWKSVALLESGLILVSKQALREVIYAFLSAFSRKKLHQVHQLFNYIQQYLGYSLTKETKKREAAEMTGNESLIISQKDDDSGRTTSRENNQREK